MNLIDIVGESGCGGKLYISLNLDQWYLEQIED